MSPRDLILPALLQHMTLSTPFLLSYLYWLEVLLRHPPHCVKVMYFVLSLYSIPGYLDIENPNVRTLPGKVQ